MAQGKLENWPLPIFMELLNSWTTSICCHA